MVRAELFKGLRVPATGPKAKGVDRAGVVTGGGADSIRQRRGEEDGAQVRMRVEVGAIRELRAEEGADDAARVRVSGV